MNNLLMAIAVFLTFSMLIALGKVFGESGIIGFMGVATITANILICKSVNLLGISATLGNVMFASNFLATDILTEVYGVKSARKGVLFAITSSITFLACTQFALLFVPNEFDTANEAMLSLFSLTPRITAASVTLFALSNAFDVTMYEKMRIKSSGKRMWLRNNVCTILCNGGENFAFYFIAFGGIFPADEIIAMGMSATIIEVIIALCDTPFLYFGKRIVKTKTILS